jgi:hypothetical protein
MSIRFKSDQSGTVRPETGESVPEPGPTAGEQAAQAIIEAEAEQQERIKRMLGRASVSPRAAPPRRVRRPRGTTDEDPLVRAERLARYTRDRVGRLKEARLAAVREQGQRVGQQIVAQPALLKPTQLLIPLLVIGDIVRPVYQRPLDDGRALGYGMDFDWNLFGRLDVNVRTTEFQGAERHNHLYMTLEGKRIEAHPTAESPLYVVLDGQHRARAAQLAFGDDVDLPVDLYHVQRISTEADVFQAVNTTRVQLAAGGAFRARVVANDEIATGVLDILRQFGLRPLEPGEPRSTPGTVSAIRTLEAAYVRGGPHSVRETLRYVRAIWGLSEETLRDWVLAGMWQFIVTYQDHDNFREHRLLNVMRGEASFKYPITIGRLEELALQYRLSMSGQIGNAAMSAIHYCYNHYEKTRFELPDPPQQRPGSGNSKVFKFATGYRARHNPDFVPPASRGESLNRKRRFAGV